MSIATTSSESGSNVGPDLQSPEEIVRSIYRSILGREPDPNGLVNYVRRFHEGAKLEDLISVALNSEEYAKKLSKELLSQSRALGVLSAPENLITTLYRAMLGRDPDPNGFSDYVKLVRSGCSLDELLRRFINSAEFRSVIAPILDKAYASLNNPDIPDKEFYTPLFSPWRGYGDFPVYYGLAADKTAVSRQSCYVLYQIALQALEAKGDFWECGVFKGGTAAMLAEIISRNSAERRQLCLFDTFSGMPATDPQKDLHKKGDFSNTSLNAVTEAVGHKDIVSCYPGFIPKTFAGLEPSQIALAHVDVDIYRSVLDCCEFVFPRISVGGFIVFDDYGLPSCPGARAAVNEYFADKEIYPVVLPTGQAIVFKNHG